MILDDDRLAENFRHLLRQDSPEDLSRSARRKRYDEADEVIGKRLRLIDAQLDVLKSRTR